jgi:hypothetical protein
MPAPITHIHFIKQIIKENKDLFSKLNKNIIFNGAVAPDLYYGLPTKKHKYLCENLSAFWHGPNKTNKIGLKFAKDLIKYSKNKKELAFAIGFLSHFILDMQVHNYLIKIKLMYNINHLVIENFLDCKYKENIPLIKFPKRLMREVFKKECPNYYYKYKDHFNLIIFIPYLNKILNFISHFIIKRKYKSRRNTKRLMIWDIVFWIVYYKPIKKLKLKGSFKKFIYPDYNLKEKHIQKIEKEIKKAKIKFIKKIKQI